MFSVIYSYFIFSVYNLLYPFMGLDCSHFTDSTSMAMCSYLQKILLYYYMTTMEQYFHSDHAHGLATNEAEIQNPTPIPMPSTTPCSTKATSTSQPLIVFDSYGEKSAVLDKNTHIYLQNHRVKSKQIIRENYPNNSIILNCLV